jgi:hypothetical protein
MHLLHIDSSISGMRSVSRQLTASIVARVKETNPGLTLPYHDLAAEPLPHLSESMWFAKLVTLHQAGLLPGEVGIFKRWADAIVLPGATELRATAEIELELQHGQACG